MCDFIFLKCQTIGVRTVDFMYEFMSVSVLV